MIFGGEMLQAALEGRKTQSRGKVWEDEAECPWGQTGDHIQGMSSRGDKLLTLEITRTRLERIQDITAEDARAQGIEQRDGLYRHYLKPDKFGPDPIHSFQTLWERNYGPSSWVANPMVWVVEFQVIR